MSARYDTHGPTGGRPNSVWPKAMTRVATGPVKPSAVVYATQRARLRSAPAAVRVEMANASVMPPK